MFPQRLNEFKPWGTQSLDDYPTVMVGGGDAIVENIVITEPESLLGLRKGRALHCHRNTLTRI